MPTTPEQQSTFQVPEKASLATKEGWRAYVDRKAREPQRLSKEMYAKLSDEAKERYDDLRVEAHRGITEIRTPAMCRVHDELDSRLRGANGLAPIARTGVFVSGPPRNGKTTTGIVYGREYERRMRARFTAERTSEGWEFLPTAYLIAGRRSGSRVFMRKALDFYGQPWKSDWSTETLTKRFVELAHLCGTQLVILDQLQNWDFKHQGDQEVSAHFKELVDTCGFTILGLGIDLENSGFFSEGRGRADITLSQNGGRFSLVPVGPMSLQSEETTKEWIAFLRTIEQRLLLFDAQPGDLARNLYEYIWLRTRGVIGETMDLLLRGANRAIDWHRCGQLSEERITEEVLETITLSRVAEVEAGRAFADEFVPEFGGSSKRGRRSTKKVAEQAKAGVFA